MAPPLGRGHCRVRALHLAGRPLWCSPRMPVRDVDGSEPPLVAAVLSNPVVTFVSRDADLAAVAPVAGIVSITTVIVAGMLLSRRR